MNLAHVCVASGQPVSDAFGGAVQRRILELSKAQAALGHRVVIFSTGSAPDRRVAEGVTIRFIPCLTPMPIRHAEYVTRLLAFLARRTRPDVLHFHGQPEGVMIAKALARPSALFYDDYFFRRGWSTPLGALYQRMLATFDLLLPCSQYCLEESMAYWRLDDDRASVQHNGVNIHQFRPDRDAGISYRRRLGIDEPIVLYVGRVNTQKGTDLLLRSMPLVTKRVPATLVVAGPVGQFGIQAERREVERWRRDIHAVGGIYLGPVHEADLPAVYNMADVFVMPTRTLEMFGMAAVEAQACGIPVVASDHGGLRETVPELVGARFPVGDAESLSEHIVRLLEDERGRAQCSVAAIENARGYAWDRVALQLEEHYARVGIRG